MNIHVDDNNEVLLGVQTDEIDLRAGDTINLGSSDYSSDYNDLTNKPSIEGVELVGDVSLDDLGVAYAEDIPTDVSELINDAGYITEDDIPPIPTKTSDLLNDNGFITASDIPPVVNDLGNIDPSEYEDDISVFLNTLLEDGAYRFIWEDGDDFEYYVVVESMLDNGYVYQRYWYSEEGSKYLYNCSLTVEDGVVVDRYEDNYVTLNDATRMFATKSHAHYESKNAAMSVLDWCDSNDLTFDNSKPFILYTDTLNNKNWLIERYATVRQPNYRFIRVYDTSDASHFYIRSGSVNGNTTTWGSWEEYTITADENVKQQYQAESGYSYWRPLLVGKSAAASEGFTPSTVTDQTYTFKTLECQPSTGTIRMGVASMFKGSYESKISPDTLTADRTVTIPDKNGTMAMTSDIPTDTGDLTNNAGFITLADLPIYNGGVS